MIVRNKHRNEIYSINFNKSLKDFFRASTKKYHNIALITDSNVHKIFHKEIMNKDINILKISPGEKSKSNRVKEKLENKLLELKFNRDSLIIAFGGGVIGDLTGYLASTYLRGVDLVHIPTSLVAIVDSSIGGKTGINNNKGKNLIGTFYNPKEIIVNSDFLKTLPNKEIRQGMAEIIKYGIIKDYNLFKKLEKINNNFLDNNEFEINKILKKCIKIKVEVIQKDFKESDLRSILNFGHTIGHGLEKLYSYKKSHGDCIGTGMAIESLMAKKYLEFSSEDYKRILKILDKYHLRKTIYKKSDIPKILEFIKLDKKNKKSKITFSLPDKIGNIKKRNKKFTVEITDKKIEQTLKEYLNEI